MVAVAAELAVAQRLVVAAQQKLSDVRGHARRLAA